ncbi:MAG TPA: hypothetical protein VM076_10650 [Gemmatimonadaceae bacterium]|nr:hypothetical protein [Gemmatimonadaceae bacterium]
MRLIRFSLATGAAALLVMSAACAPDARPRVERAPAVESKVSLASDTSYRTRPGYVVDSALSVEEELRRFRVGLGAVPVAFAGGASTREALVRRFFAALSAADTSALRSMLISRAEFAYLVYPSSTYTHEPYRQPPGLVWMQLRSSTARGGHRLLERARDYRYLSHSCDQTSSREGDNLLWRHCRAKVIRAPGDTAQMALFGVIVERKGQFKFASYETDY